MATPVHLGLPRDRLDHFGEQYRWLEPEEEGSDNPANGIVMQG